MYVWWVPDMNTVAAIGQIEHMNTESYRIFVFQWYFGASSTNYGFRG